MRHPPTVMLTRRTATCYGRGCSARTRWATPNFDPRLPLTPNPNPDPSSSPSPSPNSDLNPNPDPNQAGYLCGASCGAGGGDHDAAALSAAAEAMGLLTEHAYSVLQVCNLFITPYPPTVFPNYHHPNSP